MNYHVDALLAECKRLAAEMDKQDLPHLTTRQLLREALTTRYPWLRYPDDIQLGMGILAGYLIMDHHWPYEPDILLLEDDA